MRLGKVLQHHHTHVWVVQLKGEGGSREGEGKSNKSSQVPYLPVANLETSDPLTG